MSMLQTQQMGEAMFALNNDGTEMAQLFERIRNDMVANQKIIDRNRKILANLQA